MITIRCERLSAFLMSNDYSWMINAIGFRDWLKNQDVSELDNIFYSNSSDDFKEYCKRVLNDEIVYDHFGWFDDIACAVKDYIEKMYKAWNIERSEKDWNERLRYDEKSKMSAEPTGSPKKHHSNSNGPDVYEIAKSPMYQNADFMDINTGLIYRTAAYNRALSFGLPTVGIEVVDSMNGEVLGIARKIEE